MKTQRAAFYQNKQSAWKRGIPFLLSFEQWKGIWERALGPDWLQHRGQHRGQYCLARFGDQGCYEIGNVMIKVTVENTSEGKTARHNFSQLNGVLSLPC